MVNQAQHNDTTNKEKDRLCDGISFQAALSDFESRRSGSTTLKRTATSEGQRFGYDPDDPDDECNVGQWQCPASSKHRRTNLQRDKDDRQKSMGQGAYKLTNSERSAKDKSEGGRTSTANTDAGNANSPKKNSTSISKYALDYASEYHLSPFRLECQPKLTDKKQGQLIVNDLIKSIIPDFRKEYPRFNKTILFDLWWIDPKGDLTIIIKTTELYVFMCKATDTQTK